MPMNPLLKKLHDMDFSIQGKFAILSGLLILLTGVMARGYFSKMLTNTLQVRLIEKAEFLNTLYSKTIFQSLMRNDDVDLNQTIQPLENDQEITSIVVVDQYGEIRYHNDPAKIGLPVEDPKMKELLEQENPVGSVVPFQNSGGKAFAVFSPFRFKNEPKAKGVLRIDLTLTQVYKKVEKALQFYVMTLFGSISLGMGLAFVLYQKWMGLPLLVINKFINEIHPTQLEANLPVPKDEFGKITESLNNMMIRFKGDLNQAESTYEQRATQELQWVYQMAFFLAPQTRFIIIDRNNLVLVDTGTENPVAQGQHLLDIIADTPLAPLVNQAFEKEGTRFGADITFQDKPVRAILYTVPTGQSVAIRTIVALYDLSPTDPQGTAT